MTKSIISPNGVKEKRNFVLAGTFTYLGIHFVFSTKNRSPFIDIHIKDRLCAYIGGIIKELKGTLIAINTQPDHVHFYVYMPKKFSVSKFMEVIKGNSSKWVHKSFPDKKDFAWQDGYGGFTVSKSAEIKVIQYIKNQQEHHK